MSRLAFSLLLSVSLPKRHISYNVAIRLLAVSYQC